MNNKETAVSVLSNKVLEATANLAISEGLYNAQWPNEKKTEFSLKLSKAMKKVAKENLDKVTKEWEDAINANLGELWLQKMINAQAVELAQQAMVEIR
jgi:hypothetical protein